MITSKDVIKINDPILRRAIYEAFDGKCFYTGRGLHFTEIHIDHIVPKSKGGADCIENYVLSSSYINLKKWGNDEGWRFDIILETVRILFVKNVVRLYNEIYFNEKTLGGRITLREYFKKYNSNLDKNVRSHLSTRLSTSKEVTPIRMKRTNEFGEISNRDKLYYKKEDIENVLREIRKL